MKTTHLRHPDGGKGSALLMVLCLIALVTTAAVAFFSRATDNSQEENVRAQQVLVTQVCETGVDHALAGVLGQIPGSSLTVTNGSGSVTYLPSTPAAAVPASVLAQASMTTNTNFNNLQIQSIHAWDTSASTDNTATPSRNGRIITTNRWNEPQLLPSGFSATNQLPCWVYVNRDGTVTNAASSNTVGRFAYNVYDQGELLDANAAGYPSSVSASNVVLLKGTEAGADLTQLPGVTQAAVDALAAFRNPQATNGNYASYVTAAASAGFMSPVVTNASGTAFTNRFFATRQDLLRYVQYQNTNLSSALPYLTHFSRELARPSLTTNGLNNMTVRCDLTRLTSPALLGLSGSFPSYTYPSSLSQSNTSSNPDLFQTLRSAINYADAWETNGPSNVFSSVTWPSDTGLKAISIGADIIDQFTTNASPIQIVYATNTVAGKKQLPYVSNVFLVFNSYVISGSGNNNSQNKNTNQNQNSNWTNGLAVGNPGSGNQGNTKNRGNSGGTNSLAVMFSVIPQVYTPTNATIAITASLGGGTLTLSGVTNVTLPSGVSTSSATVPTGVSPVYALPDNGNAATMGFFYTNFTVADAIASSTLSVSLSGLSFTIKAGTNTYVYTDFATNSVTVTGSEVSATLSTTSTLATGIDSNTLGTAPTGIDGTAIQSVDPRTQRSAGGMSNLPSGGDTSSLFVNIVPVTTNYAPASIVDTNWAAAQQGIVSVGDLGKVFRESPWRTIDFVSSNSPDKALLDAFAAYPASSNGLRAGTLNLNTPHPEILAAILSGTATSGSGTITPSSALAYASNMVSLTSVNPLTNRSQLVDLVAANALASSGDSNKVSREAAVRALAEPGQTRTWGLLVDVIAQSGNFGKATPSAGNFNVTGERRIWVSVAIDRPSCRIIDFQSEEVGE